MALNCKGRKEEKGGPLTKSQSIAPIAANLRILERCSLLQRLVARFLSVAVCFCTEVTKYGPELGAMSLERLGLRIRTMSPGDMGC